MYGTVTQIQITPDQLAQLVREVVHSELANYTPPKAEETELPEYPTRKETCKFLKVSNTTLHEWGKDTEQRPAILVPLKINGRVRYRRSDILAALKEKRQFKAV